MTQTKMGRPTSDPKPVKITVRISEESNKILETYCKKYKKTKVEGVRDGIDSLKNK